MTEKEPPPPPGGQERGHKIRHMNPRLCDKEDFDGKEPDGASCEGRVGTCSQTHETTLPGSGPWASQVYTRKHSPVCNPENSNFYNQDYLHPDGSITHVSLVDVPTIPWGLIHAAVLPSILYHSGITGLLL